MYQVEVRLPILQLGQTRALTITGVLHGTDQERTEETGNRNR